jgi:hypothetical protein
VRSVLQSVATKQAEVMKFFFHTGTAVVVKKLSNDLYPALFLLVQIHFVGTTHMKDTKG